jgi:hypothetical protein
MKTINVFSLLLGTVLSFAFAVSSEAQSTDLDNPTVLTASVIEGEGDGKVETFYYSFTAMKGDVKVTVDAKTDKLFGNSGCLPIGRGRRSTFKDPKRCN